MNFKTIFFSFLLLSITASYAHNGEKHSESEHTKTTVTEADSSLHNSEMNDSEMGADSKHEHGHNDMDMSAFSTLHPLIVHFPIVLLIILPFFQLISFWILKKEIGLAVIIITLIGFVTAYLASSSFHPHTAGLSAGASDTLKEHDFFAYLTVWVSLGALIFKLISQFLLKSNRWSEYLTLIILIVAAYAVIMAGHHGAQLTHIYGVGPQGKFLQMHHH